MSWKTNIYSSHTGDGHYFTVHRLGRGKRGLYYYFACFDDGLFRVKLETMDEIIALCTQEKHAIMRNNELTVRIHSSSFGNYYKLITFEDAVIYKLEN